MLPAVARAPAVAAIAFPICHLVMEAKATTRGVSVKKRTWACMHVVGKALYKRVFWEYPTTLHTSTSPTIIISSMTVTNTFHLVACSAHACTRKTKGLAQSLAL